MLLNVYLEEKEIKWTKCAYTNCVQVIDVFDKPQLKLKAKGKSKAKAWAEVVYIITKCHVCPSSALTIHSLNCRFN